MGHIRHQTVIALFYSDFPEDREAIAAIEELRREMEKSHEELLGVSAPPTCILGPCTGINGYVTYVYAPDGSKLGWAASELSASFRERFKSAAMAASYPEVVDLSFGGDDGETRIIFTTDALEPPTIDLAARSPSDPRMGLGINDMPSYPPGPEAGKLRLESDGLKEKAGRSIKR